MTEMDEAAERERRRRYIEDMYDLVADMHASSSMPRAMPEPSATQSFSDMPLLSSARSERSRREALEAEAQRNREKQMTDAEQSKKWAEWVEQRIADALAEHTRATEKDDGERARALADLIGEALAGERAEQRKRIGAQIQTAIGELRAELAKSRGVAEGAIIDLPAFPVPRKRDPHAA
jgi:hypothetical protein